MRLDPHPIAPRLIAPRLIAPAVLVALIVAAWLSGVGHLLSWPALARYHATIATWVAAFPGLAALAFVLIYTASVALSLPQAALLTMIGGLLFGTVRGGALAVVGATVGAVLVFLIARSAFAEPLARRGGAALARVSETLRRDGFSYLLAIRLIPVVPFWLVNLAAALCGMALRPFALATLLGIMPATFVLASVGAGIGEVIATGAAPGFGVLFSWPVLGPLLALAALSLAPVLWREWRGRNA